MSASACRGTPSPRCLGQVRTGAWPSPVRPPSLPGRQGLPPNLALELLGRRPDIIAARSRTEAAARRIDEKKAGFYPSVNLLGVRRPAVARYRQSHQVGLSRSARRAGGFAAHLQHASVCRANCAVRSAEYDASVATYNATLSNALREVADAATSRKSLDGELAASRAAVAAAAEAHQIVSKRYQGELATYLDVLTAEDELISAQRSEAELETRALILDVALVRALGGGFSSEQPRHPAWTPYAEPKDSNEENAMNQPK